MMLANIPLATLPYSYILIPVVIAVFLVFLLTINVVVSSFKKA